MCDFFSFISNGEGKVFYFSAEQRKDEKLREKIKGFENEKSYDSHSILAEFYKDNFKGVPCDNCNKYEYDILADKLTIDQINLKTDDSKEVLSLIPEKDLFELLKWKFKGRNTGHRNSGDWNSGNSNSGHWNTGNRNTGHRNSGDWNSGNSNSGHFNSKTPDEVLVFNKPCKVSKWEKAKKPNFIYFDINIWVSYSEMTPEEKKQHPEAEQITGGYLKKRDYKEAWASAYSKATKEDIKLLKALPNFDAKVFEEISGIKI